MRLSFGGISIRVPAGWAEMPDSGSDAPFTLARDDDDGVGALQFSIAFYSSGKRPSFTQESLLRMAKQRATRIGKNLFDESAGPGLVGAVSCQMQSEFVRLWYVSDGVNVAFVTYTCAWQNRAKELPVVEAAIPTIQFESRAAIAGRE